MIHFDPKYLEAKIKAINFILRHFAPERQSTLQSMMAGEIEHINFSSSLWYSETGNGLTTMQARISPIYVQQGNIPALHGAILEQSNQAIDEFNRTCHRHCELVDVQLLVDLADGSTRLMPKIDLVRA